MPTAASVQYALMKMGWRAGILQIPVWFLATVLLFLDPTDFTEPDVLLLEAASAMMCSDGRDGGRR
tara:strand:- start:15296 stop:15493 length:198 start_codon:yes stop_codon:yes gene_type:complete